MVIHPSGAVQEIPPIAEVAVAAVHIAASQDIHLPAVVVSHRAKAVPFAVLNNHWCALGCLC